LIGPKYGTLLTGMILLQQMRRSVSRRLILLTRQTDFSKHHLVEPPTVIPYGFGHDLPFTFVFGESKIAKRF